MLPKLMFLIYLLMLVQCIYTTATTKSFINSLVSNKHGRALRLNKPANWKPDNAKESKEELEKRLMHSVLETEILKTGMDRPRKKTRKKKNKQDSADLDRSEEQKYLVYEGEEDGEEMDQLKNYTDEFYPAWTYDGFLSPPNWDDVEIEYFTHPKDRQSWQKKLKKSASVMYLCSDAVLSVIQGNKEEQRKECWKKMENECASTMPSPINILTKEAEENVNFKEFVFSNYDNFFRFRMSLPQDGTDLLTLEFLPHQADDLTGDENEDEEEQLQDDQLMSQDLPGVTKGAIGNDKELFLDRIIFHVGSDRLNGSEHLIDDNQFGMEIQLYFTPKNLTYWEALAQYKLMNESDSDIGKNVHVLSVLVKVATSGATNPDDPKASWTRNFDVLSQAAEMFWRSKNKDSWRSVIYKSRLLSLEDFLYYPTMGRYYTYMGSMTTPPCLTHVMWTVFEKPIWITYDQWTKFAFIYSEYSDQKYLAGNIRPLEYIEVDTSVEGYTEMRLVKGEGEIKERDLNETYQKHGVGNVRYTVMYFHYEIFFAKKVWVSSSDIFGEKATDDDTGDYDYYESKEDDMSKGTLVDSSVYHIILVLMMNITVLNLLL